MTLNLDFCLKSVLAALLIALGVAVSLSCGGALGAIFFSFGLLGVCVLGANLFTGKMGYWWRKKETIWLLVVVLIFNLIYGYFFGICLGIANDSLVQVAQEKIDSWEFSFPFLTKSIFCGIVMYLCVEMYKRGTALGIFFGVPLFILCGFQHCIANIIILGIASTFSWTIILAILGNLIGGITASIICKPSNN